MKTLLVVMLITLPIYANVEIVSRGNTDTLYVSWISTSGDACLARYYGSSLEDQTIFSDRMMASVGVCDDGGDSYHVIQTGVSTFAEGNIDVCSIEDGYWVAWLASGATEPELVFVPRDVVTGIESGEGFYADNLSMVLSPNPCSGSLSISLVGISGEAATDILIYSTDGRLIRALTLQACNGPVIWDGCDLSGDLAPSGTYLVRSIVGNRSVSARFIKI